MRANNKPFCVYFVPKTHHDLGYTHTIPELLNVYCKYYDDVIDYCDSTSGNPYESQYRYTVESFWSLDYYLKHTSGENIEKIKKYIKDGRIEIQAFYANVIDGICSEEEITRMIYPSAKFAKECGVRLKSAALTDIPGLNQGVIKALSKANIPYLFAGFPTYFDWNDFMGEKSTSPNRLWDENSLFAWGHPSAFFWKAIGGEKVFAWHQYGYGYMGNDASPEIEAEDYDVLNEKLPCYIAKLKERGVPYGVMRYVDHGLDNIRPEKSVCNIVKRWNEEHTDIKCMVATESMFFEALEKDCKENIPTIYGELPHTDYTTLSLTEAQMTGLNNHTKHELNRVEKLDALSVLSSECGIGVNVITDIYKDIIMYDEHCFGMTYYDHEAEYNRTSKIGYAYKAAMNTEKAKKTVEKSAAKKADGQISVFTLSGVKSESVGCDLYCVDKSESACSGEYISSGNRKLYIQTDVIDDPRLPYYGLQKLYGMKRTDYEVRQNTYFVPSGANLSAETYAKTEIGGDFQGYPCSDLCLENDLYKITVDKINSKVTVYDKIAEKYISDCDCCMGEVVCRNIETDMLHKARLISSKHRMSGPLADSIVLYSECFGMPSIVTEIILYHKVKRIDFCYRITMEAIPLREAFVLFPFGNSDPVFSFQGIGAPVMAFDDIIAGGNTNQYAAQHWCKVAGSDFDCVLASDEARIIEFGGINTTAVSQAHHHLNPAGWEKPYITRQDISNSHIASMILYSNCQTNFPFVQQGEVIYRYSLTTGKNVDCEGFAESFVYPPAILDGKTAPFSVDTRNGNVTVLTLKQAEDGDGMIVRLKETHSKNADVDLCKMMRGDFRFFLCDSLERTVSENSLQVYTLKPYETVTLRIKK